ncbi:hypothetical protein E4T43_07193 [Aureobasidium subglaciale]|nr:hypothetical protein E4T43_07193 [Aureobasidium subglaciale]
MGLCGGFILSLLAIILPPLPVAKRTGIDHHFVINIVLTICGWIPGVLHAWYIILRFPDGKRAAKMREDGPAAEGPGLFYYPSHQEVRYRYWRHGPADIFVQYPNGKFYRYKSRHCWSKGDFPGQPLQPEGYVAVHHPRHPKRLKQDLLPTTFQSTAVITDSVQPTTLGQLVILKGPEQTIQIEHQIPSGQASMTTLVPSPEQDLTTLAPSPDEDFETIEEVDEIEPLIVLGSSDRREESELSTVSSLRNLVSYPRQSQRRQGSQASWGPGTAGRSLTGHLASVERI